jgi:hypothetical protein
MSSIDECVVVRRQWNDRQRQGSVRLADMDDFKWSSISGGVQAPSPRPFIHAYIRCDSLLEGEVGHTCRHGPPPHRIKVCIVRKDNNLATYRKIEALAKNPQQGRTKTPR